MKFVEERHLTNRRSEKLKAFAIPKIVRYIKTSKTEKGYLHTPRHIYLPKELIGKRVKLRIEILEEK